MKILVLCTDYSSDYFVHTRNLYYKTQGLEVSIVDYSAKNNSERQEGRVYTMQSYKKELIDTKFDVLVCHAPTLKTHYLFLKKYHKCFPQIVFFFHGHEVLNVQKVYSKPYPYMQKGMLCKIIQCVYDKLKLKLWHNYYPKLVYKSHFVFVSLWMFEEFFKWTKIPMTTIENSYSIIYNSIGDSFEKSVYDYKCTKLYDFVTIRSSLDGSKYAMDIVNNLAKYNPQYKFLVVGKGHFFDHYKKSSNIEWRNEVINHDTMVKLLNESRCALMPTRTDAQGVSACEMATLGIPLIVSDIPVCHEVFESFDNVRFIKNEGKPIQLTGVLEELESHFPYIQNKKYFSENTVSQEVNLFEKIVKHS